MLTLSEAHTSIAYLAALTFAAQYHFVTKQAESMICKGTLLSNSAVAKHWIPYFIIAAITSIISSILFTIDVVDKINKITQVELDKLFIV